MTRPLVAVDARRPGAVLEALRSALAGGPAVAPRPDDAVPQRLPGGKVRDVLGEMVSIWSDLEVLEREHHLDQLHEPDLGFAWIAYRWAEGDDLDVVLGDSELSEGDFVRWMKQLLDLAGQVADAAGDTPLRRTARELVGLLRRGVVAYSTLAE